MTTKLGTILADFTTNLASAIIVGGTTATLQSATDDDGVDLVSGRYFFTIDGENSSKEHFSCDLVGTSLTNLQSISRQGVESVGAVRPHRLGATVSLTDFAHIKYINDLLDGTTMLDSSNPLEYDGTASITNSNQVATKAYVDGVAVSGAPNADTTTKGIVEVATQAEVLAKTSTGSTGASLSVRPDTLASTLLSDYKVDTGAANAYIITPVPAITAYTTGQIFSFKAVNANTTASTINVNALGVKTIKRMDGTDLLANDIKASQICVIEYNGTDFIMISPTGNVVNFTGSGLYPAIDGSGITNIKIFQSLTAGETINGATLPVPVYIKASDNQIYACDGNSQIALEFIGFAITNGTDNNAITVQFGGTVSGFSGLTPGAKYYVQDAVGTIGTTVGTYEAYVGVALSATQILIDRGPDASDQYIGSQALSNGANTITSDIQSVWRKCIIQGTGTGGGNNAGEITLYKKGKTSGSFTVAVSGAPSFAAGWSASVSGTTITLAFTSDSTGSSGTAYYYR